MRTKMDYATIAKTIVQAVGSDNILTATHCATRLRLQVKERSQIDTALLESLPEVKGVFFNAGQYQIVLGTGIVNKVFAAMQSENGYQELSKDAMDYAGSNAIQRGIRVISDIFVPIIPILWATGLFLGLKGVMLNDVVLATFGASKANIPDWFIQLLTVLTDTAFAFLTAFICWSAFKKMGGLPIIGFLIGLMLVSPALPNAYAVAFGEAQPIMMFGVIPLVGYQGSILTALITGMIGAKLERRLRVVMPNSMDLIFTPFLVILISVLLALCVLGPIVHLFEQQAIKGISLFLDLPFGLGGLILGVLYPICVMTGMHHMFIMVETSLLASTGFNPIITVCAMYGFANAAVCLAIALKSRQPSIKTAGISATATQLLGVSEPALFGIVMRSGLLATAIMILCSGLGGMVLALLDIKANSYGLAVLLSPLMYVYEFSQLLTYCLVGVLTAIVAFVLAFVFVPKSAQ